MNPTVSASNTQLSSNQVLLLTFIILNGISIQMPPFIHQTITYTFTVLIVSKAFFIGLSRQNLVINSTIPKIAFWLLLYILWSYISAFYSSNPSNSAYAAARLTVFFVVILSAYQIIKTEKQIQTVINALIFLGLIVSVAVIINPVSGETSTIHNGRESGFYNNPNVAGFILFFGIIFSLFNLDKKANALTIVILLLFMGALALTQSRSAILAVTVSFFFFTFSKRKTTFRLLYKTMYILFIPGLLLAINFDFFRVEDNGLSGRDLIWGASWRMGLDHILFGVGTENIKEYMTAYINLDVGSWTYNEMEFAFEHAHNFYLTKFCELGVIGAILAVFVIISYIKVLRRLKLQLRSTDVFEERIHRLANAIFIGWLARSLFESNGFLSAGWLAIDIYVWLLLIFVMRVTRNIKETNAQIV